MKRNLSAMGRYSSPLLFHYRQVSLCTLPFHIVCLSCFIVISETFPLHYEMYREVKDLFLLKKAWENMAQFKYVIAKFVSNEKMLIVLTKQIFLPSV